MSIGGLWGLQGTQLVMGQCWRILCDKQTERVIRVWVWVRSPDPGGVPEKQRVGLKASRGDARVTKVTEYKLPQKPRGLRTKGASNINRRGGASRKVLDVAMTQENLNRH